MRAEEILELLEARGARLHVLDGGRLGVKPSSALTQELRAQVRAHRDELRELVRKRTDPPLAPIDELDEDWRACKQRAREGYARAGVQPAWGLDGTARLELELLDGRRLLDAVYSGRLAAILGSDGRAVVFRRESAGNA
jgi:hypothetical protein